MENTTQTQESSKLVRTLCSTYGAACGLAAGMAGAFIDPVSEGSFGIACYSEMYDGEAFGRAFEKSYDFGESAVYTLTNTCAKICS